MCKNGVYIHPDDKRIFPQPVTLTSPEDYEYFYDDDTSEYDISPWGFVDSRRGTIEGIMASVNEQNNDLMYYQDYEPPLEQFIQKLTKKKTSKISKSPVLEISNRQFVIKITMTYIDEEILYRVVELPGSISLAVLHDKILSAVMGWARGVHGYVFIDLKDGTILGPKKNSGYIDMMHVKMHYYAIGDDRKFPLASLINHVGDKCRYVYDLGDHFEHTIELVEIKDIDYNPLRNVTIIDGKGACPPEDSNGLEGKGNSSYGELLEKYQNDPDSCKKAIKVIEQTATNYAQHWLGSPIKFNPLKYDMKLSQYMLDKMVEGPNVIAPSKGMGLMCIQNYNVCNYCGETLKPLSTCSSCRKVKYCSKVCQKADWKDGHKQECQSD